MLPLNSDEWRRLSHAYGPASDVPRLLEQLSEDPGPQLDDRSEPWFSLWSRLCHQDDVYTASYAAVPHIVRICHESDGPVEFSFFLLPACIEISRAAGRGPTIPDQLIPAYRNALDQLHVCAFKHASGDWDESMALSVAAALAAAKGQIKVADAIANLDGDIMDRIIAGDL